MRREWDLETDSTGVPRTGSRMLPQGGVNREDSPFGGDPVNPVWGGSGPMRLSGVACLQRHPGGLSTTDLGGVPH